jgi:hypothetical protein
MTTTIPFYFDWGFWQGATAVVALIVSLSPYIARLLKGAQLDIETHDLIFLTHTTGNPNAQFFILLRNTGGVPLRIKSMSLSFKSKDGEAFSTKAQSFFPLLTEDRQTIFAPFTMAPGQDWAHTVFFYRRFSKSDDQLHRKIGADIKNDLMEKAKIYPETAIFADTSYVDKAVNFFQQRFKWTTGEYDVDLSVTVEGKLGIVTKKCRMTIYESDCEQLRKYVDDYDTGLGVSYFDVARHPPIMVSIDAR